MKKNKLFISFLCIIFFCSLFSAQIPGLVNYNEEDGLNTSYTYHLRQDSNGFIWIGSDNGLFRFDGKEFKQYGKNEGLKNIDIISCEPLPNGEVFILPFLNDFAYLKNGRVINLNINEYLKNQFSSSIPKITRDVNKLYLYSNYNPENIFIYENGKVRKTPIRLAYKKRELSTLTFDFQTQNLYLNAPRKGEILIYNLTSGKEKILKINKGNIICEKDNFFVFENNGKIEIYKRSDPFHVEKKWSYDTKEKIFYGVIDKNNKLWLNLENGGVLYFNQSLLEYKKNLPRPAKILSNYVINNVLVDRDDNAWFNSRNNGVFFISKALFINYINLSVKNNSEYIKAIARDDKNIILGYNKSHGAIIYENGKVQDVLLDKANKDENRSVYLNRNTAIFGLSSKIIIHNISKNTNTRLNYSLKKIVPFTKDSVLFCAGGGLMVYSIKNKTTNFLFNERSYTALPYTKDSLFVGTFSDLYKLNIATKNKTLFLKGYYFTDLKKLKDRVYIGATNLNGIILFNEKGILKKITKNNGLINDQIKKIDVENTSTFWASSNSGISRIELQKNDIHISNFTQTDGLPSNAVAGCTIKNDTIFIGTSKGLGIFPIKKLLTQEKFIYKKVIINSISIQNNKNSGL